MTIIKLYDEVIRQKHKLDNAYENDFCIETTIEELEKMENKK